ncbi:MAG: ATP-binding cassette domain-containing protein, partial [Casimicrobiaceae bacterium]
TLDGEAALARARELLASVGLADRAHAFAEVLSGGEQRRVAIARALINSPRVVLADEPTSDLDEDTEAEVIALLDRLRLAQGFGLVVVSHNLELAQRADRAFEMARGTLAPAALGPRRDRAPRPSRLAPSAESAAPPAPARDDARLGHHFWPLARNALFAFAVGLALVLLADSLVGRYQQMLVRDRAEKLAALETLALGSLRASVKAIGSLGEGRYELTLELWNVGGERPIHVMSPTVRAYAQIGTQWIELPLSPIAESSASVLKITGRQSYRYVLEARLTDYAKLFSQYMHIRIVNTMLISPHSVASEELFERTDSYYLYLKPWNVDDREILKTTRFDGAPPLWIPMPPH